jgi:hypothetical protein
MSLFSRWFSAAGRSGAGALAGALVVAGALVATAWTPEVRADPPVAEPSSADRRLRALEAEVAALKAAVAALAAAAPQAAGEGEQGDRTAELARRIDVLAAEIERLQLGETAPRATAPDNGMGPAASKVYRTGQGLAIGGYGELLYQGFAATRDDGSPSGETATLDLARAVVYFGYRFDDRFLFNSELEVEHARVEEGADGEAAIEFAYLDYLNRPALNLRAGLLLVPMGFLNELHEPTTFLSAQRPLSEELILPSTWREIGFGLFGDLGPFTYRAYLVNGMAAAGFAAEEGLAEGKQEGSQAQAEDFAAVARLDYEGVPGLLVGGALYSGRAGQDLTDPDGRPIGVRTTLYEGHFEWRAHGFQLRALGVRAHLADVAALDRALGLGGDESVGEALDGWYVEAGYDVLARRSGGASLVPFARWERLDTQAAVPAGFARDPANRRQVLTLGLAFKPIDQVVIKADWQNVSNDAGTGVDRFSVALGYIF